MNEGLQTKDYRQRTDTGFTILEIIISLAIMLVLTTIVMTSLFSFRDKAALDNSTEELISLLNDARVATLSSRNEKAYGVHIDSYRAVLFIGPTYASTTSSNVVVDFDGRVSATTTMPTNPNYLFTRLTGAASSYGTTTLYLTNNASTTRYIYVSSTGIVERK